MKGTQKGQKIREQGGITLIALIITIIVLLIIAGVAIAVLNDDNGIINKATEAKENYTSESIKEDLALKIQDCITKAYFEEGSTANLTPDSLVDNGDSVADKYEIAGLTKVDGTNNMFKYQNEIFTINNDLKVTDPETEVGKIETTKDTFDLSAAQDGSITGKVTTANTSTGTTGMIEISGTGTLSIPSAGSAWTSSGYASQIVSITLTNTIAGIADNGLDGLTSLKNIGFTGTKAEWEALVSSSNWKGNLTQTITIICSDGTISA